MIFILMDGGVIRDVWTHKMDDGECPVVIIDPSMTHDTEEEVIISFNAWDASNMPAHLKALCNQSKEFLFINEGKLR